MVAGDGAAPVHGLAVGVPQHIHQAVVGEGLQDPVGGGERHRGAALLQDAVQFLGADEVLQFVQGGADGQALLGDALFLACGSGSRRPVSGCCRRWRPGTLWNSLRWWVSPGVVAMLPDYQPGSVDTALQDP